MPACYFVEIEANVHLWQRNQGSQLSGLLIQQIYFPVLFVRTFAVLQLQGQRGPERRQDGAVQDR